MSARVVHPSDLTASFERFFKERSENKKELYGKITSLGYITFAGGLIIVYTGTMLNFMYALISLGALFCSCGICIFSTIPTDEMNLDEIFEKRIFFRRLVSFFVGSMVLTVAAAMSVFPPYIAFLLIFGAIWMYAEPYYRLPSTDNLPSVSGDGESENTRSYWRQLVNAPFTSRLVVLGNVLFVPTWAFFLFHAAPVTLVDNSLISGWMGYDETFRDYAASNKDIALGYAFQGVIYLIANVISVIISHRIYTSHNDLQGFRMKAFYSVLYCWLDAVGVAQLLFGIYESLDIQLIREETIEAKNVGLWLYLIGVALLSPSVVVLVFGSRKCFRLMARYFEHSQQQLAADGAEMALLVSSCEVIDTNSNTRWVRRLRQSTSKSTDSRSKKMPIDDNVSDHPYSLHAASAKTSLQLDFWMLGTIVKNDEEDIVLKLSKSQDDALFWASYKGNNLETRQQELPAGGSSFETWKKQNFICGCICSSDTCGKDCECKHCEEKCTKCGTPDCKCKSKCPCSVEYSENRTQVSFDAAKQEVTLTLQTPKIPKKTSKELQEWVNDNMRAYEYDGKKFEEELFKQSPREVQGSEVTEMFKKSAYLKDLKGYSKVDYFISHAWDDDAMQKYKIVKEIGDNMVKRNMVTMTSRKPTFWFDKVCIDHSAEAEAMSLAVLPINLSKCRKVLILLGEKYLMRLWCIWELFSIFVFANKELAMERVEIKCLGEEDATWEQNIKTLENFDISTAHCFDPNEEFKLRTIIEGIGIDTLQMILRDIAAALRANRKKRVFADSIKWSNWYCRNNSNAAVNNAGAEMRSVAPPNAT